MDKYIITVESGGTKSHICAFDRDGNLLKEINCGGVGSVGDAELTGFLSQINELSTIIPFEKVSNVVVNLGGTNDKQVQKALSPLFPNGETEVYRESSGVIMRAICEMENADILLMAGTGTICLAKGDNGCVITDGWGINIGDKGSGYWIGMEAVSRSLLALESKDALGPLARYITGREKPLCAVQNAEVLMKERDEVRRNFLPAERAKIAGFAKDAARFGAKGDQMAKDIFRDAGKCLAQTVMRSSTLAGLKDGAGLLVSGGLIHCYDLWGKSFEETLRSGFDFNIRVGEVDMTRGMLYLKRGF